MGKFFPDGFKPDPERDIPVGKWRSVSSEVNAVFADHLGSTALLKCRSDVRGMCDQLEVGERICLFKGSDFGSALYLPLSAHCGKTCTPRYGLGK